MSAACDFFVVPSVTFKMLYVFVVLSHDRRKIVHVNVTPYNWGQVFPNAACISTMLDRLIHRSELVVLKGNSFRYHEAQERKKQQQSARRKTSGQKKK